MTKSAVFFLIGEKPLWEERPQTPYLFLKSKTLLRLSNFCWIKISIDDKVVEAKNLVIYITKELLPSGRRAKVSIGYYEELPQSGKVTLSKQVKYLLLLTFLCNQSY